MRRRRGAVGSTRWESGEGCDGAMGQRPSFGEQLRHFRELAGLTQDELAARAGLTANAIGMIERGERRSPYPHTVRALAAGLGLDDAGRARLLAALPRRGQANAVEMEEPTATAAVTSAPSVADPPADSSGSAASAAPRRELRDWFPQTKLRPPQVGATILTRPHLLAQSRAAALAHRLTLVAAPAGSGKTTLLAALPGALTTLPVAWLALDADDNDPTTFAAALVAALRVALPALGRATESLLDSLPDPGAQLRRLMGTLINDLVAAPVGPFVLVLDDLHTIGEAAIHAALDHLLERLPDDAHVVVGARYDPPLALARLRARGQLAELRLSELRFSPSEAGELFNERLALGLPESAVRMLYDRVEGWAAGLRLLALIVGRLGSAEERQAFVGRVGEDGRYIFDFMAEEVLGQQEPELQRFLLDTAILPVLTVDLCRAVTGRDDAAHLLDRTYRRNLFLTRGGGPVAETGSTFRYHDLFAEFLRGRLQREAPEHARDLHRRAGEAATDPASAIAHYIAAECWDDAARLIEAYGADFARPRLSGRLHDWIMALPEAVRGARPRLIYLLGAYAYYQGHWEVARPLLERAEGGLAAAGDLETAAAAFVVLINIADRSGARERIAELAARWMGSGPLPERVQLYLAIGQAWASVVAGNYAVTEGHVAACVDLTLASDDPALWNVYVGLQPPLALGPSGPAKLETFAQGALRRTAESPSPLRAVAEQLSAYLQLVRGQLDAAAASVERSAELSRLLGSVAEAEPGVDQTRFALALLGDTPHAAERYIADRLPQIEQSAALRSWLPGYRYLSAKAHWLAGRLEEAGAVASGLAEGGPYPHFPILPLAQQLLDGMLATSAGDHTTAERHLQAAVAFLPPYFSVLFWLDHPRVLLAHAYEQAGRPREALAALGPVLEECERLDTPGIILKVGPVVAPLLRLAVESGLHAAFAARALRLLHGAAARLPVPGTGETLSPREMEVLGVLAAGGSNAAIADALGISPNMVKAHVARIVAKLGVASRTQAATRARDLGIG